MNYGDTWKTTVISKAVFKISRNAIAQGCGVTVSDVAAVLSLEELCDEHGHKVNVPPKPCIYTKPTQKYCVFSHFSLLCVLCSAFVSSVSIFFLFLTFQVFNPLCLLPGTTVSNPQPDLFNLTAMNSRKLEPIA